MRPAALLPLVLSLASLAVAEDRVTLPIDDPPPSEVRPRLAVPPTVAAEGDEPAIDAPSEGIWAWVARMEGEVLTEAAVQALHERAEARQAEGAVLEGLAEPDVPSDVYQDPTGGLQVDPLRLSEFDPAQYDIPMVVNADVRRWMRYFLGSGRSHFQRYLTRSGTYLPMMIERLERAGMPRDLVYLAMIESGFNAHALSHAGAAGLWQFMPATGRMYKLRVDWWVDDRRDPVKATEAAVAHLADLHKMFNGDWYLAWSAYNAGPGRVRRAMQAGGTRDFWAIVEGGHLPSETANYTPKLLAAAILAKNAERYGFDVTPAPPLDIETVWVDGAVGLSGLATASGVSLDELKHLNPGLRRAATPAEGYALTVPRGRGAELAQALQSLPAEERARFARHTVARGETLSGIAARHGVSADEIVRANNLVDRNRIVVGMSLLIPRLSDEPLAPAPPPAPTTTAHTVLAGESLSAIARQHGVSTANLRTWNSLSGDTIHPGQILRLTAPVAAPVASGQASRTVRYAVAPGDTLSGIAARYGVTLAELQAWNDISDPSLVRVGQMIEVRRAQWATYTVKPGDSLGRIAQNHRCSVDEIREWNRLSGAVIHPGQELRIRR